MIVYKQYFRGRLRHGVYKRALYEGWFLFGFIPLYIRRKSGWS